MTGCLDDSLAAQSVAPESKLKAEAFTDIWSLQIENIPSTLLSGKQKLACMNIIFGTEDDRKKAPLKELAIEMRPNLDLLLHIFRTHN